MFVISEESPPKKRKLDEGTQINKSNQANEEKIEIEPVMTEETSEEKVSTDPKEEAKSESESKETETAKASSVTPSASGSSTTLTTSRNDLIKDIESHIEIIYECLDELNETGPSSSANKTSSNEIITISSEASSHEADKSLTEATENDCESVNDPPPAHDESKNE